MLRRNASCEVGKVRDIVRTNPGGLVMCSSLSTIYGVAISKQRKMLGDSLEEEVSVEKEGVEVQYDRPGDFAFFPETSL